MKRWITTSADIRSANKHNILKFILNNDPISRADISRQLNFSKSVTTEITAELLNKKIIYETPANHDPARVGRRPILLSFNKNYRHFIAIDLNQEMTIFSLTNMKGEILRKTTVFISRDESFDQRYKKLEHSIQSLITPNIHLSTIALSSPGVFFDKDDDYFVNLQFQHWQIGSLIRDLRKRFNVTVDVYNDVNAAIIGEHTFGVAKDIRNFTYISMGLGLGAAIMLDNKLYEGPNKGAGEIGDFILANDQRLEDAVDLNALKEYFKKHATHEFGNMSSTNVMTTIMQDEYQDVRQHFVLEISRHMSKAINDIVSLLDVEMVVLGGLYDPLYDDLIPLIQQTLNKRKFSHVQVVQSELNSKAGIYGLIALSIENELTNLSSKD